MYVRNYRLSKTWLDYPLKSAVSEHPSVVKSAWEHFYHFFASLWVKRIWKRSFLFKVEIIGVFVKTLTADYKYPVQDCEKLRFPIQMQLS